ncbi:glycosyl hydrolase family 92-domain-containing protein [Mycena olivaceomarginata]|nr:glycosyl hydrolase family 92-domain-containing protein [Mycena olivaceomarginata]
MHSGNCIKLKSADIHTPVKPLQIPQPLWIAIIGQTQMSDENPTQFVNPLIGTKDGGHVFSGATLPWGSVKAGADSDSPDGLAGYVSDGTPIFGFSSLWTDMTMERGAGILLGNFPLLPLTSTECAGNDLTKAIEHGDPTTSPGYFGIPLNNGVNTEVTITQHTALYRFTYQAGTDQLLLLLEVTGGLFSAHLRLCITHVSVDLGQSFQGIGQVTVASNPTTKGTRVTGSGSFIPSVFFCADISIPFVQAKYYENLEYTDVNQTTFDKDIQRAPAGLLMGFAPGAEHTLSVRMGVSWTSTVKACAYAEQEIPDISAFDTVHTAARAKWNEVDATGVSDDSQQLFWTSLYRTYISPTNITGDNPLWSKLHRAVLGQDTFRAEVIRALIDIYRHTGFLPDCRMSLDKGFTQGGSNADSLLADSFVKGITAGIDWQTGFAAMLKDAQVEGDWEVEGRGRDCVASASRLLEYAYNDFSIALVAQGLDSTTNATHFFNKSSDWFNLWNFNASNTGFAGFIQPRNADGSWFFDSRFDAMGCFARTHCSQVFWASGLFLGGGGGEFYEASSWEYSWYAMGGADTFSARLDTFFSAGFHDMGDEPGFLPTYLYNYVGQPVKTVDRVDATLAQYYNTSFNGLPGNDDSGAMGAYAVWTHLGFYPVGGQDTYLLSRRRTSRRSRSANEATGAVATIIASGLSDQNKYIQSATLDGQSYTKNWLSHKFFSKGGTLTLVMGSSKSSAWARGKRICR